MLIELTGETLQVQPPSQEGRRAHYASRDGHPVGNLHESVTLKCLMGHVLTHELAAFTGFVSSYSGLIAARLFLGLLEGGRAYPF